MITLAAEANAPARAIVGWGYPGSREWLTFHGPLPFWWFLALAVILPTILGTVLAIGSITARAAASGWRNAEQEATRTFAWRCLTDAALPIFCAAFSNYAGYDGALFEYASLAAVTAALVVANTAWYTGAMREFEGIIERLFHLDGEVAEFTRRRGVAPFGKAGAGSPPDARWGRSMADGQKKGVPTMGTQKKKITASSVLFALAAAMFCVAYAGVALCVLWLGVATHQPAGYKPLGTVTILGLFGLLICFLFTGSPLAAARATHRKLNAMGEIRRRLDAIEASLRACDRGGEKSTDATPADGNHGDPAAGEESTG